MIFSNGICRNFTAMSSRTLLFDHVHSGLGVRSIYKFILIFLWPFPRMSSHMHVGWTVGCVRKINVLSMMPQEMSLTETATEFISLSRRVPCV